MTDIGSAEMALRSAHSYYLEPHGETISSAASQMSIAHSLLSIARSLEQKPAGDALQLPFEIPGYGHIYSMDAFHLFLKEYNQLITAFKNAEDALSKQDDIDRWSEVPPEQPPVSAEEVNFDDCYLEMQ